MVVTTLLSSLSSCIIIVSCCVMKMLSLLLSSSARAGVAASSPSLLSAQGWCGCAIVVVVVVSEGLCHHHHCHCLCRAGMAVSLPLSSLSARAGVAALSPFSLSAQGWHGCTIAIVVVISEGQVWLHHHRCCLCRVGVAASSPLSLLSVQGW